MKKQIITSFILPERLKKERKDPQTVDTETICDKVKKSEEQTQKMQAEL